MIYRLKRDLPEFEKAAGCLLFEARHSSAAQLVLATEATGYGRMIVVGGPKGIIPRDAVEANPATTHKDFRDLMAGIAAGRLPLPNVEPVDTMDALRTIACGGGMECWPRVANVKVPGRGTWGGDTTWARLFLTHTQMAGIDGRGYAILYQPQRGDGQPYPEGPVVRFAICQHEPVAGANARPDRGWNPAHCPKCGLNMSVDSSD